MSTDRANWDEATLRTFLELVIEQKNLLHWNQRGLTTVGWSNLYPAFENKMKLGYDKKQLQNKLNDLKRSYFVWRDLQTHTGLGRDPITGGVAVDPSFFEGGNGENSQSAAQRTKVPNCLDLLVTLWGRTPHERGTLLTSGGHHRERTPSTPSNETPHDMSQEPLGTHGVGQSSKRSHRKNSINSPPSKKIVSIDECLEDLTQFIKNHTQQKAGSSKHDEEMAKVKQIMNTRWFAQV